MLRKRNIFRLPVTIWKINFFRYFFLLFMFYTHGTHIYHVKTIVCNELSIFIFCVQTLKNDSNSRANTTTSTMAQPPLLRRNQQSPAQYHQIYRPHGPQKSSATTTFIPWTTKHKIRPYRSHLLWTNSCHISTILMKFVKTTKTYAVISRV